MSKLLQLFRSSCSLQWGRDQLIAEIYLPKRRKNGMNRCFNGAAIN